MHAGLENISGKVVFAGAGPGDPDLITVRAARAVGAADVIICDRLVSRDILKIYALPQTHIIFAGKQSGNDRSCTQAEINDLLLFHARLNKNVLRLKGGDVSIFSNLLDELQTICEAGIKYEIIPGITAASGAAAWTGIPLTARGYATGVRFLTLYDLDNLSEHQWVETARCEDTLVFYMSAQRAGFVVSQLINSGMPRNTLLAVIEQATTPLQKVNVCALYEFEHCYGKTRFASPSLLFVGKVVSLHKTFSYKANTTSNAAYFPEPQRDSALLTASYAG